MPEPKFKVDQVVMFNRGKKRPLALTVLEVTEDHGTYFYRVDRRNCLAESMLRALDEKEKG